LVAISELEQIPRKENLREASATLSKRKKKEKKQKQSFLDQRELATMVASKHAPWILVSTFWILV